MTKFWHILKQKFMAAQAGKMLGLILIGYIAIAGGIGATLGKDIAFSGIMGALAFATTGYVLARRGRFLRERAIAKRGAV